MLQSDTFQLECEERFKLRSNSYRQSSSTHETFTPMVGILRHYNSLITQYMFNGRVEGERKQPHPAAGRRTRTVHFRGTTIWPGISFKGKIPANTTPFQLMMFRILKHLNSTAWEAEACWVQPTADTTVPGLEPHVLLPSTEVMKTGVLWTQRQLGTKHQHVSTE